MSDRTLAELPQSKGRDLLLRLVEEKAELVEELGKMLKAQDVFLLLLAEHIAEMEE